MKVGVGYSDNPESSAAGLQAAKMAVAQAGRTDPCDMTLLFSTARHDYAVLRGAVASVVGGAVPIYGGGSVGIITNEYFGYAGDQIAAACVWLDGVSCEALVQGDLNKGEEENGIRLGKRLAESGLEPDSPVLMFYETFDFTEGCKMMMATWLLTGIEKGLGFVPDLTGAGLMGNHAPVPTKQWIGGGMSEHNAIALAFSGDIRMDSVIMHGCCPATGYYTVTKAAGQAILEINGKPAIQFIDELLNSAITPEDYPFFLLFGVNHGERWGDYDEDYYASRLCLGIDKESGAIIMFEPDMVEGTEFQIMFRSMELDYIKPKIDRIFAELDGREPVFAVYINCAGRCAGYGGSDLEDALVIQETVAGRVPILGLYTGVEIASIGGRPRGLDWTGVFCLFSQRGEEKSGGKKVSAQPDWDSGTMCADSKEVPVEAMVRISEQNTARFLALDRSSISIRYELEQKRRGFSLLSELSVSLRQNSGYENIFIPASRRINAALNMQRTAVLVHDGRGRFNPEVLQGYTANEKTRLAGRHIKVPAELLDPDNTVIVTGADPAGRFSDLRELLGLPYFISSPVIIQGEVYAILITGRLVEAEPYLVRLSRSDSETVQAISALLASVLAGQRLTAAEERNRIMIDAAPMCCVFWDENGNLSDCNKETLSLFGLADKNEFIENFSSLSPEFQPDGRHSETTARENVLKVFVSGETTKIKWTHKTLDGGLIPTEVTSVRIPKGGNYFVAGYIRDLREQEAAQAKMNEARETAERYIKAKNEFLASVSHEIRTPMNAIQAMVRIASEIKDTNEIQRNLIERGLHSVDLLTSAIEAILDFSKLDSGQMALETEKFSVRELINGIGNIVRKDADEKSIYLNVSVDSDVPDLLLGDHLRLQQTIFNIVINAVKFTESGGVDVHVFKTNENTNKPDETLITFEVRDTGIGITDEQMTNMLNPLYCGDMSYTRKYSGLGMGLPVSTSLATLMGGKITFESRPGHGSVFWITIPLTVLSEKTVETGDTYVTPFADILRGLRVLVAEDNNINQMIIEELLCAVGIETTIANNGIETLAILQKESFDIVLMDIQMPEMDGLTATAQIRTDRRYAALPVLALTANAGKEHYEESIKSGMNDFLTKPIDSGQLYNSLIKWSGR
ncbi:MAG: response regulator [Oscillospiraceae bacterium]|nr:response regulator [Oscillospiraceae bacterium]